jgi:hypothetical protein
MYEKKSFLAKVGGRGRRRREYKRGKEQNILSKIKYGLFYSDNNEGFNAIGFIWAALRRTKTSEATS